MLKWGLRLLAIFAVLFLLYELLEDIDYSISYLLVFSLVVCGFLSLHLLLASLLQRFVLSQKPYWAFVGTMIFICLALCSYGYYNMVTDTHRELPGLLGILIIMLALGVHIILLL